ncbi:pyrroloquinoline quinone biosynthesis protein PqqE [Parasaccharibacter sp. TMW2.1882]|uniref:PqqA peptide cyclase n=2 Tax=Acetobacteraceae TaxID=433 RepID=A0ABX4ZQI2_9PROT|nr:MULTISPECIES: pyrroloquinoline quinone biosynthesis protein PqqE [Acetobacteraceae]MCL1563344.1 pyrroloquinoline quinone biosynthesis protein PqqE [Parasaccharibacter sp. TMW 2.1886]MCQ0041859.1 pyrroloquinoline quinone biosynthesis protein PqqE [Bombella sp.]MUG80184.1 pyrroloquinoline quinone biosynthesis protein PqqE [Bombella sp. ESL0380]MBE1724402.1 pyrroloquinoline quinone biosynthesis protein PqqE [Bombella apis]MCK8637496.1 pyrroloquinoline quinone biosynthesis protein PqqE [Parasac
MTDGTSTPPPAPMSLLAELTHRCPLSCPYCSNPVELERKAQELGTEDWLRVLEEAAGMGVLQVHFSGGEPMARPDLYTLISHAHRLNLYTNLITSGVLITPETMKRLDESGLDHVQLSFQDTDGPEADRLSDFKSVQPRKLEAARLITQAGIPLTLNFVLQKANISRIPAMFALARQLDAQRVEMAHTQYYGWALKNRAALLPSRTQLEEAGRHVEAEMAKGGLAIDYVTPDYYAERPKPCMGGWGQRFLNVSPSGHVLPCHAAETIPSLHFDNVRDHSLSHIWYHSQAFTLFRGTDWMPEPCASCARKEIDWGGCRCQALALLGDASQTDPVCSLSPHRHLIDDAIAEAEQTDEQAFIYRRMGQKTF